MRVRGIVAMSCLSVFFLSGLAAAQENDHSPSLLLRPNLLRRLQRDRQRQTPRWQNFEKRVQTVPASSERGFELALYYAVTGNEQRGKDAVAWALAHSCETRQIALVLDWVSALVSSAQREVLKTGVPCSYNGPLLPPGIVLRDSLFRTIAFGQTDRSQLESNNKQLLDNIKTARTIDAADLYASVEYLMAVRTFQRADLRQRDPQFFSQLPKEFLLSLKPEQVEHPAWMAHVAALALVTLDPNLESSQFLQGWAMEDSQMLREGPGVAYELLWADPYLPGIAYQNMDPWIYNPSGRLFARVGWNPDACWVAVTPGKFNQENCPADVQAQPPEAAGKEARENQEHDRASFGTLTLITMPAQCAAIPTRKNSETSMLWKLNPHAELAWEHAGKRSPTQADAAGMWPVPDDTSGKVCLAKPNHR